MASNNMMKQVEEAHGRERVADLLLKHIDSIEALRTLVGVSEHYEPSRHDDLWLLRFVLTHAGRSGGLKAAAKAALATLAFRKAHDLDAENFATKPEVLDVMRRFYAHASPGAVTYYAPDADRGVMIVGLLRAVDFHKIANDVTAEETLVWGRVSAEWVFRQCDEVTRRTGYLTKYARIVDMKGWGFSQLNRAFQKRQRESSKELEDFYPQMLGAVFLCHPPGWIQAVWRVWRNLMPPRFVEKIDIVSPKTNADERRRLVRFCAAESLPSLFGGPNDTWPLPQARGDAPPVSASNNAV